MLNQRADLIVDGKPYMLVRSGDHVGPRSWQEEGPLAAEVQQPMRDVARTEGLPEFRISWPTKHRGFGEPIRTLEGRDYYGQNVDKRFPRQTIIARGITTLDVSSYTAGADPCGFAELGGVLYLGFGRYMLKIASNDGITNDEDLDTIAVGVKAKSLASYGGKIYLAVGESYAFRHTDGSGTYTAQTDGLKATLFHVAENRLYRIYSVASSAASYLSNASTDPTTGANWAAADPIGDTMVAATGMANLAYQLFIAKEDGLYAADTSTGRFPSITPELKPWKNSSNGVGISGWGGMTFMPTVRGLKMYFGGQLFTAGPEVMSANDSEVKGRITSLGGDANWLYAALYNGTGTYILAGRAGRADDQYPGEFLWNVVWYVTGGPYALHVSGLNNDPRLWLAAQGALHYIKLGNALDNPLQDSTAVYQSTATDYYPAHDAGSPMVDKHFLELRVYAENLSYARYVTWSYRLDDETDWTPLGVTNQSPIQVLKFDPAVDVVGKRIQLKAAYTRGATTTATPIIRNVEVLGVEYPPQRKILQANILVADQVALRKGTDSRSAIQLVTDLEDLFADRRRVAFSDPLGREKVALPIGAVSIHEVSQPDERNPIMIAQVQFLMVG